MLFRTLVAGTILTAGAFAQMVSFPKPQYFRETIFRKPEAKVELQDPVRLKDFVVGDKLELSLKNYLALVMANNTNIQIQVLSLESPKNAIQRAFAAWDPTATASFSSQRSKSIPNGVLDGTTTVSSSLSQPFSANVRQTLDTGTSYTASFGATKSSSNSSFNSYNPSLSTNMSLAINQPLLRGRGRFINRITLTTARSTLRINELNLRQTLTNLIQTAENAYWAVIQARENLKVAVSAREVSSSFLDYMQKQLDLGALSPLDIYNPQQNLAQADLNVANARFNLLTAEDALRLQMGADLDPAIRKLPIELTETVDIANLDALTFDSEQVVAKALASRTDLKGAALRMDNDDLSILSARNGLLPQLTLTGSYNTQGRGGIYYQRQNVFTDGVSSTVTNILPGGIGDALSQMFGFGYPVYSVGLQLNLPIKSHTAAVALADAMVSKKSDALSLRNQQQSVRLSVLNAITNVNGSKEQLKLARISADFAQKNLDAMKRKYELGTEINQNVINAQQALVTAQNSVVQQQVSLQRNLTTLLTSTGELLEQRGVVIQ
jgi:outer membrane protein